jgi:hypothetical protein
VEWNQHRVCGDECIEREQSKRRRAINEDVIELAAQRIEDALQSMFSLRQGHPFQFQRR